MYQTLYNTHLKEVDGMYIVDNRGYRGKVEARFTSDEQGETLSLSISNLMIIVDYEDLIEIIDKAREERTKS